MRSLGIPVFEMNLETYLDFLSTLVYGGAHHNISEGFENLVWISRELFRYTSSEGE